MPCCVGCSRVDLGHELCAPWSPAQHTEAEEHHMDEPGLTHEDEANSSRLSEMFVMFQHVVLIGV